MRSNKVNVGKLSQSDKVLSSTGLSESEVARAIVLGRSSGHKKLTAFGNSITESAFNFAKYFTGESNGSVGFYYNAGVAGDTTQDMIDRLDDIPTGTTICTVMEAVNDAINSVTPIQHAENMKFILESIISKGITPILVMSPPSDNTAYAEQIEQMNLYDWVTAQSLGVKSFEIWDNFTDASTAGWKSGNSDDGTHPTSLVQQQAGVALGEKYKLDEVSTPKTRSNNETSNILPNSCFLVESASPGTPEGYTSYGGGTRTITPSDVGNSFTFSDVGTSTVYVADQTARASVESGKVYLFTCFVTALVSGTDRSFNIEMRTPGGTEYLIREARESIEKTLYSFYILPESDGEFGLTLRIVGTDHDVSVSVERAGLFCLTDFDVV